MVQVFSYCGVANKVRVYEVYAVVNYRTKPTVKVTAPTGTVDSSAPVVSWTYSQPDGDPQQYAEYRIYTAAQQEAPTFNPDATAPAYPPSRMYTIKSGDTLWGIAGRFLGDPTKWPIIYAASPNLSSGDPNLIYPGEVVTIPGAGDPSTTGTGGSDVNTGNGIVNGDITSFTLPFGLEKNDYYIFVRATSSFGARSDWAQRAFTVTGSSPGAPGGTLGGIGTGGGGGFESVIADSVTSNVYVSLRDGSNLLSVQQADFETLTDSLGYVGTNCTLAMDQSTSFSGGASMSLTSSGTGNMSAQSSYTEIAGGSAITGRAQFLAVTSTKGIQLDILFYDDTFTATGSAITATGTDVTGSWTELVATGYAPNDAVYATLNVTVNSTTSGNVHNVDHLGLMYGTNSQWSNGGHASRNLLSSAASNADDPISTEPWTADTGTTYSRVATTGTGADGAKAFKMLYAGLTPTISVVATGTAYTDTTTGTGYTLNKPASVADGDVLVAYVAADIPVAATPPDGWTVVDSTTAGSGTSGSSLTVMMRDGLAADPSTWTGNFASSRSRCRTTVVAYRGAAPTAQQFPQENVSSSTSGGLVPVTAAVTNGDPGAWRLSAFAVRDDASGGAMTANITPSASVPPIQYVGKGASWQTSSTTTSFTINRPSGVVSGDLMLAGVSISGAVTVTAPSGWTLVRTMTYTNGSGDEHSGSTTLAIMKRTAGSSESASWTGSHTSTGRPKITQCVAYRNCDTASNQFIAENGTTGTNVNMTTPTITNTDSRAWRVAFFAPETSNGCSVSLSGNSERADDSTSASGIEDVNLSVYDSNGNVSTGSHTLTAKASDSVYSTCQWIGLLKPLSSGPGAGANETERQDATAGSSTNYITLAAYDSNAAAATGTTNVYGTFTPGSGSSVLSSCAWLGFLIPSAPTTAGEAGCTAVDYLDISNVSQEVMTRAGNRVTVQASFLGSTAGVPHVKLYSYVGNELVSTQIAEGASFNTSTWTKAVASFVIPDGITRLKMGVSAMDRAVNDYVLFDRCSVALGGDTTYRPGTGKSAHPIFSAPIIEYAEDLGSGYGSWKPLAGTPSALMKYDNLTGLVTFVEQTVVPLSSRKYRAKTISWGLAGDSFISGFGPESPEVTLVAQDWWLKDLSSPNSSLKLKVKAEPLAVNTNDTSAVFQPLGADRPFVVSEGYKGDTLDLTLILERADYLQLRDMFNSTRTLFLQSNLDNAWWVRPYGDIGSATQLTGKMHTKPLRFVKVSFVEVDPEV
jgi:LysM repeat protein